MVSKASEDLPDPETPVTTVRVLWGTSKSTSFRLWTRAPRTTMLSVDIGLPERGSRVELVGTPQELPQQLPNLSIIRESYGVACPPLQRSREDNGVEEYFAGGDNSMVSREPRPRP